MAAFVEQQGLWSDAQHQRAESLISEWREQGVEFVRFVFPDQHSQLRGKTLVRTAAEKALYTGVNMTSTLLAKDTSHKTVFPVFSRGGGFGFPGMQGGEDFVIVADPLTAKILPWARNTAWVLCDPYMADGSPSPLGTRQILRRAEADLAEQGLAMVTGLEVEFHVFATDGAALTTDDIGQPGRAPRLEPVSRGFQYLTEQRYDELSPLFELLHDTLVGLDLPLRSLEIEYGPSQVELTFGTASPLQAADNMVLLRSAVKQVCRRQGLHATFMCRPKIPSAMASGWHLHQSLTPAGAEEPDNLLIPAKSDELLSPLGQNFLGGLVRHAQACAVFTTPTINGYRRYRPFSLAPDRAAWGRDNRGVMLRVIGGAGAPDTRIENRVGEPAANPYLYIASQIFSGLDGIRTQADPGPSADEPYSNDAEPLPKSLPEALVALSDSDYMRKSFGDTFVDYFCHIKYAELERFNQEVTEWEEREYLDMF